MRICFICDQISPGRGGVGDYTVALAEALREIKVEVSIISLMDSSAETNAFAFPSLRLLATESWAEKLPKAKEWIAEQKPSVISLQYVPYAYHPKGLPHGLTHWLKQVTGNHPVHIFFHELWVAAEQGATVKNQVVGWMQKQLIASMLKQLAPAKVHTSNQVYIQLLANMGWGAELLPLFSNIQPHDNPETPWAMLESKDIHINVQNRGDWLVGIAFGTIHRDWNALDAAQLLTDAAHVADKKPLLIFAGRNGNISSLIAGLTKAHKELAICQTGPLQAPMLTGTLQIADFGFSASPWALAGKSSAAKALLAHGLPTVFTNNSWRLRKGTTPLPHDMAGCYLNTPDLADRIAKGLPRPKLHITPDSTAFNLYQSLNTVLDS